MSKPLIIQEALRIGGEKCPGTLRDSVAYTTASDGLDSVVFRKGLNTGYVSLVNPRCQHRLRLTAF